MPFDPSRHLIDANGGRYLPVHARVLWFRERYPDWGIETELHTLDVDNGLAVARATVRDPEGRVVSQATAFELQKKFPEYIEKAESSAVARALTFLGFIADEEEPEQGGQDRRSGGGASRGPAPDRANRQQNAPPPAPPPRAPAAEPVATPPAAPAPPAEGDTVQCVATGCRARVSARTAELEKAKCGPPQCQEHWGKWMTGGRDHVPAEIASRYPTAQELEQMKAGSLPMGGS